MIQKGSATNKTKDIIWKAYKEGGQTKTFEAAKGKLKLTEGGYATGNVIVVRASVMSGGPQTSIRLTVVKASKNVEFQNASGAKITKLNNILYKYWHPDLLYVKPRASLNHQIR